MSTLRSILDDLAASYVSDVLRIVRSVPLQELLGEGDLPRARSRSAPAPARPSVPLQELPGESEPPRPRGRPAPARPPVASGEPLSFRSADDVDNALGKVVALLRRYREGMRAEDIGTALGISASDLANVIDEGLRSRVLRARGRKSGTVYVAASS